MNDSVVKKIREACLWAKEQGLTIKQGIWFEWDGTQVVSCDPLGAVLLQHGAMPPGVNPLDVNTLTHPGFVKAICTDLKIDGLFLRQFWMGFDRGHQVFMIDDKDKLHKDEVSSFGISLWREMSK